MSPEPFRIDVHHHIMSPQYMAMLEAAGGKEVGDRLMSDWDPSGVLEWMDGNGIATVIASLPAPVYVDGRHYYPDVARSCNEHYARIIGEHPRRFGGFAMLPLPDVDAALAELEYSLDTLGLDGVVLASSVAGVYLGDPEQNELFDELERRKAVVFIHPYVPPGADVPLPYLPDFLMEFVLETTRTVASLLFTGTLERCPNIRFILSHAGGTVPYLVWRFALGQFLPGLSEKVPQGVEAYLRRIYYDTALSASPHALRSLQECADLSHILFGADYPPAPEAVTAASIQGLEEYNGFDDAERQAVYRDNALALFPRLEES